MEQNNEVIHVAMKKDAYEQYLSGSNSGGGSGEGVTIVNDEALLDANAQTGL